MYYPNLSGFNSLHWKSGGVMEYTDIALKLMEEEKWFEAQEVLKEAAEKEPCCETYNNMGVFYIDNGIQFKNSDAKEAKEKGCNYLKMAYNCDINYKNLIALAEYNYHYGSTEEACKLYKKASEIKGDYRTYNNLACGCYRLGGYVKACMYFDKALKIADKNIDDIKISYCYSFLKCREDYSEILESISDDKWTVLDRFILYYFLGDKGKAYSMAERVIAEWEFGMPVLAMLYECIEENNIAEISKFDSEVLSLVDSRKKRERIINEYEYTPVMLWQCKYIGCIKH